MVKKKNFAGFSLVEVLVGVGILLGASYVGVNTFKLLKKNEKTSSVGVSEQLLLKNSLSNAKQILFSTADSTGKRNLGLCEMVFKKPETRPPIGPIYLNLSSLSQVFRDRLEDFLPEWELVNNSHECGGGSEGEVFCLKGKGDKLPKELKKGPFYLQLTLSVHNMNPQKGTVFDSIADFEKITEIDVKNIGFRFKAEIFKKDRPIEQVSRKVMETFEWAGSISYCDYCDSDRKCTGRDPEYQLSVAGMASFTKPNTIFNRNSFENNQEKPVDIYIKSIVAQGGDFVERQVIQTIDDNNIETSCNEIKFRCKQEPSHSRVYGPLSFVANLRYNIENRLTSGGTMKARISYEIRKSGQRVPLQDLYYGFNIDHSDQSSDQSFGEILSSVYEKKDSIEGTLAGSHPLTVHLLDAGKLETSNHICRQICRESNNSYNTKGTGKSSRHTAYLKVTFPDYPSDPGEEEAVEKGIGCTACYMKNCDSFGLGTFGPMISLPPHPYDATIPECSLHEPRSVRSQLSPYLDFDRRNVSSGASADKCVSAHLKSTGDKLSLRSRSCNDRLPVLCFNFGRYFLAQDISSDGRRAPAFVTYDRAAQRCFETGREVITNRSRLNAYLGRNPSLPTTDSNYDFINLASSGLFIAPQTEEDIEKLAKFFGDEKLLNQEFWIALNRDGQERTVVSRVPVIPNAVNRHQHALYFDGEKNLIHKTFPGGVVNEANGVGILFHNIKYKGVKIVKEDNPLGGGRKLPFICRKKTYPYLALGPETSANIDDGPTICQNKGPGWAFLPPLTTLDWVLAMTVVEELSENHPFPDPKDFNPARAAWLALEIESEGGHDWKIFKKNQEDQVRFGVPEGAGGYDPNNDPSAKYFFIDERGFYKDLNSDLSRKKYDGMYELCINGAGRLEPIRFYGPGRTSSCSQGGKLLEAKDIKDSESMKAIWSLNGLPVGKYLFKRR